MLTPSCGPLATGLLDMQQSTSCCIEPLLRPLSGLRSGSRLSLPSVNSQRLRLLGKQRYCSRASASRRGLEGPSPHPNRVQWPPGAPEDLPLAWDRLGRPQQQQQQRCPESAPRQWMRWVPQFLGALAISLVARARFSRLARAGPRWAWLCPRVQSALKRIPSMSSAMRQGHAGSAKCSPWFQGGRLHAGMTQRDWYHHLDKRSCACFCPELTSFPLPPSSKRRCLHARTARHYIHGTRRHRPCQRRSGRTDRAHSAMKVAYAQSPKQAGRATAAKPTAAAEAMGPAVSGARPLRPPPFRTAWPSHVLWSCSCAGETLGGRGLAPEIWS